MTRARPPPFKGRTEAAEYRNPAPKRCKSTSAASSAKALIYRGFTHWSHPLFPHVSDRERIAKLPQTLGEDEGASVHRAFYQKLDHDAQPGSEKAEAW